MVFESELVFVCMNYEPLKPGHVMVLPKRHMRTIGDLNASEADAFTTAMQMAMDAVKACYEEEVVAVLNGMNYRSQEHLHVHIVPSRENVRGFLASVEGVPRAQRADDDVLVREAEKLREQFGRGSVDGAL